MTRGRGNQVESTTTCSCLSNWIPERTSSRMRLFVHSSLRRWNLKCQLGQYRGGPLPQPPIGALGPAGWRCCVTSGTGTTEARAPDAGVSPERHAGNSMSTAGAVVVCPCDSLEAVATVPRGWRPTHREWCSRGGRRRVCAQCRQLRERPHRWGFWTGSWNRARQARIDVVLAGHNWGFCDGDCNVAVLPLPLCTFITEENEVQERRMFITAQKVTGGGNKLR